MIFALLFGLMAHAGAVDLFLHDIDQFTQADKLLSVERDKTHGVGISALSKKLSFTPTLSASFGSNQTRLNNELPEEGKFFRIGGDWNLFRGGSDYYSMLSSSAAYDAQKFSELSQKVQVELKASEIIFKKIFMIGNYQANLEQKKLKEAALQIAKERYKLGRISLQELNRIEIDLSQQLNRMRQIEIEKIDLEQKIKSSFVQKISTEAWPLSEGNSFNFGDKSNESQKIYWSAQSKKHSWRSAKLRHVPTIDFNFSYSRTDPTGNNPRLGGYFGDDKTWATGLTLTIPIWSQLQTTSEVAMEYAGYQESQAIFDVAEAEEISKREALQKKISILKESVLESKKVLSKEEDLYKSTMRGFQFGKVPTSDLFAEQSRLIDTRQDYSQNQMAYHLAVVEACGISGKNLKDCLAP